MKTRCVDQQGKRNMSGMKPVLVNISKAHIKALDQLVKTRLYPNRNEAIRAAIRDLLLEEQAMQDKVGGGVHERRQTL